MLGRQNYLIVLPCLLLFLDWPPATRRLSALAITALIAIVLVAPVFLLWGGLLPPRAVSALGAYFQPFYVVLSFGYLGVIAAMIAPYFFAPVAKQNYRWWVASLALITVAVCGEPRIPMHTVLSVAAPAVLSIFGWIFTFAASIAAIAFIIAMSVHVWAYRDNHLIRFCGAVIFLGALSNIEIHQFSSRYIFIFLPFLLLMLAGKVRLSWHLPMRLTAGALVGLLSLASYFR